MSEYKKLISRGRITTAIDYNSIIYKYKVKLGTIWAEYSNKAILKYLME